jgi:hypothetical protein
MADFTDLKETTMTDGQGGYGLQNQRWTNSLASPRKLTRGVLYGVQSYTFKEVQQLLAGALLKLDSQA